MSFSLVDLSDAGGGIARKAALSQWEDDLNTLEKSLHAYMASSSRLIKQCPINHYDPLNADASDSQLSISIPETFDHVSTKIPVLALLEEQVKMSRVVLTARRNRMTRISFVSRLPVELLQEIFRIVVAEHVHPLGDEVSPYQPLVPQLRRKPSMALVFTWVCQLWRDVALNTPDLWNQISFDDEPPFNVSRRWITRSQDYLLHISISPRWSNSNPFFNTNSFITTAMSALTPRIQQWGSLNITADHTSVIHQAWLCVLPKELSEYHSFPKLRSLHLTVNLLSESLSIAIPGAAENFFKAMAKRLHTICLRGVALQWDTDIMKDLVHLSLLFPNVTASTVRLCPTANDLSRIILSSSRLQSLQLGYFEIRYPTIPAGSATDGRRRNTSTYQRIELHRLTTLRLRKLDHPSLEFITHLISAPALDSLLIEDYGPHASQDIQSSYEETLLSFMDRYNHDTSSLRSFHWISKSKSIPGTPSLIKEIVGRLPNIVSLGLQSLAAVPLDLVQALAFDPGDSGGASGSPWWTPFAMSLSTLRLIGCTIGLEHVMGIVSGRRLAAENTTSYQTPLPCPISLLHWRFNLDSVLLMGEDKSRLRGMVDELQLETAHVFREEMEPNV